MIRDVFINSRFCVTVPVQNLLNEGTIAFGVGVHFGHHTVAELVVLGWPLALFHELNLAEPCQ